MHLGATLNIHPVLKPKILLHAKQMNPPLPPRMTTCRSCKQTQRSPRNTVRRHCGEWRRREPGSHRAQLSGRPASGPIPSFPSFATSLAFSLLFLPTQSSTRPTGRAGRGHLSIHPCIQTDIKSNQPHQKQHTCKTEGTLHIYCSFKYKAEYDLVV